MPFDPYLPFKPAPVRGKNPPIEVGSFAEGVEDPETADAESEESKNESPSKK
jgi:hypothetical protein